MEIALGLGLALFLVTVLFAVFAVWWWALYEPDHRITVALTLTVGVLLCVSIILTLIGGVGS